MQYRRRLRSRILLSFLLFGTGLTALFALATLVIRAKLEDQLINDTLARAAKDFVEFKRAHPEPQAIFPFSPVKGSIFRQSTFANVPFAHRLDTGVYDIEEPDDDGKLRRYKLAVYKADDYWAFWKYDVSNEVRLGEVLTWAMRSE